jgi:hypothetical protein
MLGDPLGVEDHGVKVGPDPLISPARVFAAKAWSFFINGARPTGAIVVTAVPGAVLADDIGMAYIPLHCAPFYFLLAESELQSTTNRLAHWQASGAVHRLLVNPFGRVDADGNGGPGERRSAVLIVLIVAEFLQGIFRVLEVITRDEPPLHQNIHHLLQDGLHEAQTREALLENRLCEHAAPFDLAFQLGHGVAAVNIAWLHDRPLDKALAQCVGHGVSAVA